MSNGTPISGLANAPFKGVREAFAKNFADDTELGASFAVFIDGEPVVDLLGGYCDRAGEKPWSDETLAGIYSSGKAVLAMLVARAVTAGQIDYDAPVARYWPEFAGGGKETITVADVMSHQAGLSGLPEEMPPETWLDWEAICRRIEKMAPLWPPRTANGYSPQLVGFVVGELLRRTTGRGVAQMLREDFNGEGGFDIFCAMRPEEMARASYVKKPPSAPNLGPTNPVKELAFQKPWSAPGKVSQEQWMAAEIPASNMHANARALAGIVQPLANRGRTIGGETILSAAAIDGALAERIRGDDLVLPFHLAWCAGLMRNINKHFGPSETAYGHAGFGGSCVVVDPAHRLTAAYVMNRMSPHLVGDPRSIVLLDAVYAAL